MSEEIRNSLGKLALFSEFSEGELDTLTDLAETVQVNAGDCIVRQDELGDCMFVLLGGNARVLHRTEGRQVELAELGPGDFFGELALVDHGPRSADVEAVGECTLLRVPQSVIRALSGVYPSAAFKLLIAVGRVLVERLRKGNKKYIDSLLLSQE